MSNENEWNFSSKYKPSYFEPLVVQLVNGDFDIATWDSDDRLWLDNECNVVEVHKWTYIPEGAD